MIKENKIKLIPGPHHCAALGEGMRNLIFEAILRQADENGGSINRNQIEKLRHAFAKSKNSLFDVAINTHDFCMGSINQSQAHSFDKSSIFRFLIGAYISDLLPTIFKNQLKHDHGKWKTICSAFLADIIQSRVRAEVYTEYFDLYKTISQKKGRNFTLTDLVNDHDVLVLTRFVIEQTRDAFTNLTDIPSNLCAEFNAQLRNKTNIGNTHVLFIKVRQMEIFLNAVLGAKPGNNFRTNVLGIKLPPIQ